MKITIGNKEFTNAQFEEIMTSAREFAKHKYQEQALKCMDGDPKGFNVFYNSRSKKFTTIPLFSKRLSQMSKNARMMCRVCDNGSLESQWTELDFSL